MERLAGRLLQGLSDGTIVLPEVEENEARGLVASKSLPEGKRTAVISSFQGAIESYFEKLAGDILPRDWHFAVFDGWDGGIEPASAVHVCEQDFAAMVELAADLLLKMLGGAEVASKEFEIPPARIFDVLPFAVGAN